MRYFLLFLFLIFSSYLFGQLPDSVSVKDTGTRQAYEHFDIVSVPRFYGGNDAAKKHFTTRIVFPFFSKLIHKREDVIVSFVVLKDGKFAEVTVTQGRHRPFIRSVLKAVNAMPKFLPPETSGHPPKAKYQLKVSFQFKGYFHKYIALQYTLLATKDINSNDVWVDCQDKSYDWQTTVGQVRR